VVQPSSSVPALLRLAKSVAAERREVLESGDTAVLLRHAAEAWALLLLTLDGNDVRVGLVADGAIDTLAATALTSLDSIDVNKCSIGAHPSAISELVGLVRRGGPRERREAATALYELAENRRHAVREGAAPALADFAAVGSARAVEVLGLLAKCREGRQQLCKIPSKIEQVVLVLNWICSESNELALETIKAGI